MNPGMGMPGMGMQPNMGMGGMGMGPMGGMGMNPGMGMGAPQMGQGMGGMGFAPPQAPKRPENFAGPGAPPGGHKDGSFNVFGNDWSQQQQAKKQAAQQEFHDLFNMADSKIKDRKQENKNDKFSYNAYQGETG